MIAHELFRGGGRRWVFFGRDPKRKKELIDTNVYLVTQGDEGVLLDPGGLETFPEVISAVSKEISLDKIRAIFASHQDPDIISSLALWMELIQDLRVHASWVWSQFIPHFGAGQAITPIPDEGGTLALGGTNDLEFIPAHYLHSSGNFNLYDPVARILFSGDIGAALLPEGETSVFVEDFQSHVPHMAGFHRRWMPSNEAKNDWVARVSRLAVHMMCPQHGSVFQGNDVRQFLDWFGALEVGVVGSR